MSEKPHSIRLLRLFHFSQSGRRKNNRKAFEGASMEPTTLIIKLKGKLQKPFDSFLRCHTCRIWLAHLLVEIPRGFQLGRNWSIQLRQ